LPESNRNGIERTIDTVSDASKRTQKRHTYETFESGGAQRPYSIVERIRVTWLIGERSRSVNL